jgi:DNA ligase-1
MAKPKLMLAKKVSLDELQSWTTEKWKRHVIEPKIDGDRYCREPNGRWVSRGGKEFYNVDEIKRAIDKVRCINEFLIDGELTAKDWSQTQSIVRSFRKKPIGKVRYIIFDAVPDDQPELWQQSRYEIVRRIVEEANSPLVECILPYHVTSFIELKKVLAECVANGCDGVMVKQYEGPYETKRSKYWLKLKPYHEMDCKVVAVKQGKGKYSQTLGSIGVVIPLGRGRWSDRITHVSGMSDQWRDKFWKMRKELIGKIVEVRYREKTKVNRLKEPRLVKPKFEMEN